ncbi:MAG: type I-C CRISPR-associated protein Cas7/Csd2 [Muribaculaceae bacterium]|nr:type I-C CRISPR-associated protein Cas7/Csd2 [Muribaculaceae bacterium]
MKELKNRIDFVYFFDVEDGNPNGDPDAGNLPRMDVETGTGLVTDVCLKRKVRNYVEASKKNKDGYKIFIQEKAILGNLIEASHDTDKVKAADKNNKTAAARQVMCGDYYDVRTFGAVMSIGKKDKNAGQVRGPVQFTFARSIDPIVIQEHTITRMAVATEKEAEKQNGDNRTMGRKATVPYGLYRAHGFISPNLAAKTGFSEEDKELLFEALCNMFDIDHSAARGLMGARKLIVFRHDSELGNAPAHKLFDLVKVTNKNPGQPARSFEDYTIEINKSDLPKGVEVIEII